MMSNEERVLLHLRALGGKASNEDLLRVLGWSGPSARTKLGHIIGHLKRRGMVERRRVERRSFDTIYELKQTVAAVP
jgi:uncharacterized membrane protein